MIKRKDCTVEELDDELHDARIPLESIGLDDNDVLWIWGTKYGAFLADYSPKGPSEKFDFTLTISAVQKLNVVDNDRTGIVSVGSIIYDDDAGRWVITSNFDCTIHIVTTERHGTLKLSGPTHIRRWFRWKPVTEST